MYWPSLITKLLPFTARRSDSSDMGASSAGLSRAALLVTSFRKSVAWLFQCFESCNKAACFKAAIFSLLGSGFAAVQETCKLASHSNPTVESGRKSHSKF